MQYADFRKICDICCAINQYPNLGYFAALLALKICRLLLKYAAHLWQVLTRYPITNPTINIKTPTSLETILHH